MMIDRPLGVDLARGLDDTGTAPAHVLDDRCRVVDEQPLVIEGLFHFVEDERRSGHGVFKARRIHVNAESGAGTLIALSLEIRSREDQCEIDVEKDRARPGHALTFPAYALCLMP